MGRVLTSEERARSLDGSYGIPHRPPTPEGWSPAAWRLYLDFPGGVSASRRTTFRRPPDTTPTAIELMSREEDF